MATYTRRVGRAIVVGCLLAMAATIPAHAAGEPAPQLLATSLTNGWSHYDRVLSAQYDSVIVRAQSNVTVTDKNSVAVTGVVSVASIRDDIDPQRAIDDQTILVFKPDRPFTEKASPYTATLSAHALDQDPTVANTVDTFTFKLDIVSPLVPRNLKYPAPVVGGAPLVIGPSDKLSIEGDATDSGKSGIARLEAHFFNPVENVRQDPKNTVAVTPSPGLRTDYVAKATLNIACGATCPATTKFKFDDAIASLNLMPGYWTVRVVAIDLAGNVSGESASVNFLLARSPA